MMLTVRQAFYVYVGTPHKTPIFSRTGFCEFESMTGAAYMMHQGIPAEKMLRETASYDTIGNAFFSATIHAIPCAWRRIAVVTSAFHMPRTKAIFDKVFTLVDKALDRRCIHLSHAHDSA
jgi:uncharacterized SAM-binding protein YcdF (DUF218 family)